MADRRTVEELKTVFETFKDVMARQRKEIKSIGNETGETRQTLERLHDRMDSLETKSVRPNIHGSNKTIASDHEKAFTDYIRKGEETELKSITMNETLDPQGGYLVPPQYADHIIESLVQFSPIRKYARTMKVHSKEFKIPVQQQQNLATGAPQAGLFRTGWTADLGPVNQTDTGQVGMQTIMTNDLYALPYATQDMLDDGMFNIEAYIQENLAKSLAFAEGSAFINGTGVGQPFGLVTQSPSFPSQVQATTGLATGIGTSPSFLIDAFYALPDYYARNGTWLMNRQTIKIIREWVDGNGQYLWTPTFGVTIDNEAPARILDRPYAECIDMAAPDPITHLYTAGAVPILFGDLRSAYLITDRIGIRVLRDPYSVKPFVLFYTTSRVGGQVVLPEAMVALKVKP